MILNWEIGVEDMRALDLQPRRRNGRPGKSARSLLWAEAPGVSAITRTGTIPPSSRARHGGTRRR